MSLDKENNVVYRCLVDLEDGMKRMQEEVRPYHNDEVSFLKEFSTIKVCSTRRAGHTTAVAMLSLEKMMEGENILVMSVNFHMAERIRDLVKEMASSSGVLLDKITARSITCNEGSIVFSTKNTMDSMRGIMLDRILVDIHCMWSKSETEAVYRELGPSLREAKNPCIMFLE